MEHRPFAFHKMEALVKQMQDSETGVPVRSQKIFLTSIPSAFTGFDLIGWLMEHLNVEECVCKGEAVHLANQLCQYGYLFPVPDCKSLTVKDDSSLYRFQAAYYWPWHHRNPDNIEYAIYLVKRSNRNKQRHALEEYELEALTTLKKNLQNKWDLITMQSEEQLKVAKERKKNDKQVGDSQEKAYWRVHRPPPGCLPPLDPGPLSALRKTTQPSAVNSQLEILRRQVSKSRVKVSQAVDSLVNYCQTYCEYDPFLTPAQPSNPWLSDDSTYWHYNQPIVETPTDIRVKRWGLSFEDLLSDPSGVEEFTSYLRKEYSHENIRFWLAVKDLRRCSQSQVPAKVQSIYEEFLVHGAPCEINIDSKTLETTLKEMKTPTRFVFDVAAHHVYNVLLNKDCYPRFIRSDHYKNLLANAPHPPAKKRFFGFVGGGKKKSCAGVLSGSIGGTSGGPTGVAAALSRRRGSDRSLSGHEPPLPSFPHSSIPLSSSQHDISSSRDSGVSPERIVVPSGKHVSFESKFSSEEEKAISDENLTPGAQANTLQVKSEPETSVPRGNSPTYQEPLGGMDKEQIEGSPISLNYEVPHISPTDKNKEVGPLPSEFRAGRRESKRESISSISSGGLLSNRLLTHASESSGGSQLSLPTSPVRISIGEEEEEMKEESGSLTTMISSCNITDATSEVPSPQAPVTLKVKTESPPPIQPLSAPGTTKEDECDKRLNKDSPKISPRASTEQLAVSDSALTDVRRSRKTSKTRVMSEEHRSERRREPANRRHVSMDEEDLTSSPKRTPPPPGSDKNTPAESVCPWEDEDNCKTEETFVKKYATLGYL